MTTDRYVPPPTGRTTLPGGYPDDDPDEPDERLFRLPRPEPAVMRDGLRLLRRRGWALALLGVVALSLVFVGLGRWQYHRHEGKVERRDQVRANYDATPAPVAALLSAAPVDRADQWRPLRASGHYEAAGRLAVRNRPLDGAVGFHDLVPLRLPDGTLLVVDRGWIPGSSSGGGAPADPPPLPAGDVGVVARIRPFEPPATRGAPAGQVSRIDRDQVVRALSSAGVTGDVLGGYAVLAQESPAAASAPTLLPKPDVDLGVHLAYAYQWWIFAVALYGILAVALYREADRRRSAGTGAQARAGNADNTPKDVTVGIEAPPFE